MQKQRGLSKVADPGLFKVDQKVPCVYLKQDQIVLKPYLTKCPYTMHRQNL